MSETEFFACLAKGILGIGYTIIFVVQFRISDYRL